MIVSNAFVMGVHMNAELQGDDLTTFQTIERFFLLAYTLELGARLVIHGWGHVEVRFERLCGRRNVRCRICGPIAFTRIWIIFDAALVSIGILALIGEKYP